MMTRNGVAADHDVGLHFVRQWVEEPPRLRMRIHVEHSTVRRRTLPIGKLLADQVDGALASARRP